MHEHKATIYLLIKLSLSPHLHSKIEIKRLDQRMNILDMKVQKTPKAIKVWNANICMNFHSFLLYYSTYGATKQWQLMFAQCGQKSSGFNDKY